MLRLSRSRRPLVRSILLALVLLAVASAWPLSHAGTALIVAREIATPDVILMLASHEWERLPAAAALARQHPEAAVLLTVPRYINEYNCHRCGERVAWFEAEGVSARRVAVLPDALNTYGEATAVRAHLAQSGFRRLLVVTSPYHTRRALAAFRHVFDGTGIEVGVVPAAGARGMPEHWWLDPYDRFYVRYEWAAIVKYRLFYGIPMG